MNCYHLNVNFCNQPFRIFNFAIPEEETIEFNTIYSIVQERVFHRTGITISDETHECYLETAGQIINQPRSFIASGSFIIIRVRRPPHLALRSFYIVSVSEE